NVDIGCPFVFVSFKTDYNTQSSVYFYSIHPNPIYGKPNLWKTQFMENPIYGKSKSWKTQH
uniref:hypothetical protein n=1 Tax=Streptococcus agalactiae TaxID=1311 RepID=UPI001E54E1FF